MKKVNKEKEIEFTEPFDDYFVEGIRIDWKSTFKFHERLNKLREKYGIRKV